MSHDKKTATTEHPTQKSRAPRRYHAPKLERLGDFRTMTQTGSLWGIIEDFDPSAQYPFGAS